MTVKDKIAWKIDLEWENDCFRYIFGIVIKFPIEWHKKNATKLGKIREKSGVKVWSDRNTVLKGQSVRKWQELYCFLLSEMLLWFLLYSSRLGILIPGWQSLLLQLYILASVLLLFLFVHPLFFLICLNVAFLVFDFFIFFHFSAQHFHTFITFYCSCDLFFTAGSSFDVLFVYFFNFCVGTFFHHFSFFFEFLSSCAVFFSLWFFAHYNFLFSSSFM